MGKPLKRVKEHMRALWVPLLSLEWRVSGWWGSSSADRGVGAPEGAMAFSGRMQPACGDPPREMTSGPSSLVLLCPAEASSAEATRNQRARKLLMGVTQAFFQERGEWRVNLGAHMKKKWLQLPAFLLLGLPAGTAFCRASSVGLLGLVRSNF